MGRITELMMGEALGPREMRDRALLANSLGASCFPVYAIGRLLHLGRHVPRIQKWFRFRSGLEGPLGPANALVLVAQRI